ncbi:MAG: hypothetical protein CSB47_04400 [Proteobacteria bacterium]|nr:MAG: hypothetical protein CSB47_04400 [Pseudomonadota bacterium]
MLDAVAAIFTCNDEIFSIKRQLYLRAFPGYTAFPGGKIDAGDEAYAIDHPLFAEFPKVEIGGLIREIEEELAFDLAEAARLQQIRRISKFGTALTPAFQKQRFNAHFYKIELTHKPNFTPDNGEIFSCGWKPTVALWQDYLLGEALMVRPNMRAIRALALDISVQSVEPFCEVFPDDELPHIEFLNGLGILAVPSNTLPPAITTNALLLGDEGSPRILTDPSPASPEVLQRLKNTLRQQHPDMILISHHHPDHHESVPDLARDLGVPVLCSKTTRHRIQGRWGLNYFEGIEVRYVQQDDVITQWLGHSVICHELPGHDDGMVGLAPESLAWFYVADLVEPGTTVVIPEPEGDMSEYFKTLKRVIRLNPNILIPSHGLPMGGIHLLEKTLKHREVREQQILDFYNAGLREDALVNALYPELDKQLISLAHQNVRQHLVKLGLTEG